MKSYTSFAKIFALGAVVFIVPGVLFAADFRSGEQVTIGTTETVVGDLYLAGGTLSSAGSVEGDVYAGGGTVIVSGAVKQDVVIGGGTISVLADVGDDVRIGGGTIAVQGSVAGDVVIGGGDITVSSARIGGDVLIGGGSIHLESAVEGNIKIAGGDVYINGPVKGDVNIQANTVTLGSKAVIAGNLKYRASSEATMEEGATVLGTTTYEPAPQKNNGAFFSALISAAALLKLFMLIVGALFFGLLLRRFTSTVVVTAYTRPLIEIGRGFVFLVVAPIVSILLLVTLVGIPLGVLGLFSYIAILIVGCCIAPIVLGSWLYRWYTKGELEVHWKSILLGVVTYFIIGIVPIVGGLVQFALMLLTLGAIVNIKWTALKEWR
ncbi:polymer-forming cytoskeletal protein [Acetobacteraceae bacterium]|nr:polymer-forming cytoskeletal protein [Candidatus Parcubacteria bacterium]